MENFWFSFVIGIFSIFIGLLVYHLYNTKKCHYWINKNIPSEAPAPFVISFTSLWSKKNYWEVDAEWCKKHGRIFGCYQVLQPMLYVTDPEIIRQILVKDFHIFPERRSFVCKDKVFDNFLTNLTGDDWKRVRSVVSPAFATGKLKKMICLMNECAIDTTQNILRISENEQVTDCKKIFGGFTLDVIASTAFGTRLNSANDPNNVFVQNARQVFNINFPWRFLCILMFPRLSRLLGIHPFKDSVMDFFVDLTNEVIKRRKETKENRGDFLQCLLEAQTRDQTEQEGNHEVEKDEDHESLSEESQAFLKQYSRNKTITSEEFVAQCVLFFLAGYDTTATTISMTAYHLAFNPDCQQKVLDEVDAFWKKYPEPDYEAVSQMKYLSAAISETLRMVSPAPRMERKALQDYQVGETGITVPKGMIVGFPIFAIHFDPEFFPNPDKFEPERFLPQNKDQIRPYTYLPFGFGPRNCIGMRFAMLEIKLCLLHIFKHVMFRPCAQTEVPVEIYKGSGLYLPKAVTLKVVKRQTS